jgi:hypothetical protein
MVRCALLLGWVAGMSEHSERIAELRRRVDNAKEYL